MTTRPFRFGVSIWGATTRDEWRTKARRAEAAGFDTLLIADHLVDGMFSSLSALVAAAEDRTTARRHARPEQRLPAPGGGGSGGGRRGRAHRWTLRARARRRSHEARVRPGGSGVRSS